MSDYTPGPWFISDEDRWSYESIEIIASDGSCVAKTDGWGEEFQGEEEANARLIVAAPELLEALEFVMTAHGEQLDAAFAQAQAAIAKARGN